MRVVVQSLKEAAVVACIAACSVWLGMLLQMPIWLIFLSWVSYFIFGPHWKPATQAFLHFLAGMILGVLILMANDVLAPILDKWALIWIVFAVTFLIILLENIPPINIIPAYFLGSIAVFASGQTASMETLKALCLPVISGFFLGMLTVAARSIVRSSSAAVTRTPV